MAYFGIDSSKDPRKNLAFVFAVLKRFPSLLETMPSYSSAAQSGYLMARRCPITYAPPLHAANGNPTPGLSITHKFGSDADPERDVRQPVQSAPHDDVAGWWIAFAVEIAAEFGEFDGVESQVTGIGWA